MSDAYNSSPSGDHPAVEATGLSRVYRTGPEPVIALDKVDLAVAFGSFTAVMGPSGSGKSTLLRCVAGLANTLVMTVADRRRELALLRLAGATRRQVVGTVLAETLMCVATGAMVGLLATALSIGGSWGVLRLLVGPAMPLVVPWALLAALTGTCVAVAVLAAGLPTGLTLGHADRQGLMREAVDGGS